MNIVRQARGTKNGVPRKAGFRERNDLNETQDRTIQRRLVLLDFCRHSNGIYPVSLGGLDSMGGDEMKTDKRKAAQATEAAKRGKEIVSIGSIAQKRRTRK